MSYSSFLKERSRYAKKLGVAGMSKQRMEDDLFVIQYAVNFSFFMFEIVEHQDRPDKLQKIVQEIKDFLNAINLPGPAMIVSINKIQHIFK